MVNLKKNVCQSWPADKMRKGHVQTHKEALLIGCQVQTYPRCLARVLRLCSCSLFPSPVPRLQQSNYPMCQPCLKKTADLCLLHSLPYGCLLLPDQMRRKWKAELLTASKLTLPAAPVPTWEKLYDGLGMMASGQAADHSSMPWQWEKCLIVALNLQLWWLPVEGNADQFLFYFF